MSSAFPPQSLHKGRFVLKEIFFSKVWSVSEISLGHKACSLVFWYDWTNSFPRRALKIKRSVSAPKCQFSSAGQNLIQPLLEPVEHILSQNSPIKNLFQARISALGSKSALGNRTVFTLIKCHISPPPPPQKKNNCILLTETAPAGPSFTAKTDLSGLQCV